ncbi:hypothetical protein LCGC14_0991130, partial [marine sediment metagenome]
ADSIPLSRVLPLLRAGQRWLACDCINDTCMDVDGYVEECAYQPLFVNALYSFLATLTPEQRQLVKKST